MAQGEAVVLPPRSKLEASPGTGIQRTMRTLASSTPKRKNRVRILFYGQSITKQAWSKLVAEDLRKRFPHADLVVQNRAIGGFSSNLLKRTLPHDVYGFYPDLIIFHDYGNQADYEEMVRMVRSNTTAEMLLQSDHVTWTPNPEKPDDRPPGGEAWHDAHSDWLRQTAGKYRLGFVDVRSVWRQYLQDNRLPARSMLVDGVHLNDRGDRLMAALVSSALVVDPKLPVDEPTTTLVVGREIKWERGVLRVPFDGNRVDLVLRKTVGRTPARPVTVRVDGRAPSSFPEMYAITRPSDNHLVDVTALMRVSSRSLPVAEEWTARLTDISEDARKFRFTVTGSLTGADGQGSSDAAFISNSGRVAIEPGDWMPWWARNVSKQKPPEGFEVKWRVEPTFLDSFTWASSPDPAKENVITIAQGMPSGRHTLELVCAPGVASAPVEAVRIYRPPLLGQ
jgi:lysophospholipase L1-like esterase